MPVYRGRADLLSYQKAQVKMTTERQRGGAYPSLLADQEKGDEAKWMLWIA